MESTSYFANSHSLVIGSDGNFATVGGNQIINYFNREPERKTALTIYDQFRQVIQGDIHRTKDFGVSTYPGRWDYGKFKESEKRSQCLRANRTICAAQVIGVEGRMFTVVSYTGPQAREAFERDFRLFSTTITAGPFQIYGVNTNVPTVLFYDERQPVANFFDGLGFWGKLYLESWREVDCPDNEIWIDGTKGVLCRGPAGPDCDIPAGFFKQKHLPSSVELLRDDNCLRFLASLGSKSVDREVLDFIVECGTSVVEVPEVEVHQPTFFSPSMNASVAVGGGLWKVNKSTLKLKGEGARLFLSIGWKKERKAWMTQAPSIFHRRGISLSGDLSQYELVFPHINLSGHLSNSDTTRQRRCEKPIHLFVRPLSTSTPSTSCMSSRFHYWSFDPTGQDPLPPETCEDLGLPIELSVNVRPSFRVRWASEPYKWMHLYQLARGFDPTTSDFARHLGYPIYQVQSDSGRFEDLGLANKTRKSFWARWSWAASEGSEIPAFGF